MRRTSYRGFSLVELLVVIGIIVLLIGILLPAVNRAKEEAHRIQCLSNVRQLSVAWLMYADANKGHFATAWSPPGCSWLNNKYAFQANDFALDITSGMLWPYIKDKHAYLCSNDPQHNYGSAQRGSEYSFAMNMFLGSFTTGNATSSAGVAPGAWGNNKPPLQTFNQPLFRMSQLKRPEQTLLFAETGDLTGAYPPYYRMTAYIRGTYFGQDSTSATNGGSPGTSLSKFHIGSGFGGCPVSFTDGHAIFWNYVSDITAEEYSLGQMAQLGPELRQLAAWSGVGQIPPQVTQ